MKMKNIWDATQKFEREPKPYGPLPQHFVCDTICKIDVLPRETNSKYTMDTKCQVIFFFFFIFINQFMVEIWVVPCIH